MSLPTYLRLHADYLGAVALFLVDVYAAVYAVVTKQIALAGVFALLAIVAFIAVCAAGSFATARAERFLEQQRP